MRAGTKGSGMVVTMTETNLGPAVLTDLTDLLIVDDGGLLSEVHFVFGEGRLVLQVQADSDEVDVRFGDVDALDVTEADRPRPHSVLGQGPYGGLERAHSPWRWRLMNQQGYADGFQIELEVDQVARALQYVVLASSLDLREVTSTRG
jgi:hypothetical protein